MEQARTDSSTAITYCSRASMRIQGLPAKSCQAESACIFASSYIADAPEGATVEAARDREVRRRRHTVTDTRALSREALATMGEANGGNGVIETIIASAEDLTVSRTDLTPARATLAPSQDGSKPKMALNLGSHGTRISNRRHGYQGLALFGVDNALLPETVREPDQLVVLLLCIHPDPGVRQHVMPVGKCLYLRIVVHSRFSWVCLGRNRHAPGVSSDTTYGMQTARYRDSPGSIPSQTTLSLAVFRGSRPCPWLDSAWPGEPPGNQAQDREQHNAEKPGHLDAIAFFAAKDTEDRP
ncbi:hypothetical protein C4K26_3199 [Pseudomonas chlororaphis]|nr:hypothetical protein C4K26_3199 [Pseudomonas chlororaphis]